MNPFERFQHDLSYAFRSLSRAPVLTGAAILTLALAIGANTAVFSVLQAVVLRPLPYGEPDRLVMIWSRWTDFDKTWISAAELVDYRASVPSLEGVAAWQRGQGNLTGDGEPIQIGVGSVTANILDVLGVAPAYGRAFTAEEDVPNGPAVALLSYGLWERRYAADPSVVGGVVQLNGRSVTVVGVLPPDVQLPTDYTLDVSEPTQVWVPLRVNTADPSRGSHGYYGVARLASGASAGRATAELRALTANLTAAGEYPAEMQFTAFAVPVTVDVVGNARQAVLLAFGAVTLVLLVASLNVANLLLARGEARRREIALRSALGAERRDLVRQFFFEGAVIALAATAAGLALASFVLRALVASGSIIIPRLDGVGVDGRVLAFAAALAMVTAVAASLAPALRAGRGDSSPALRDGSHQATSGRERTWLQGVLVSSQVALALLLLIGAGLMLRSIWALQRVDLGFDPQNVLTLRLSLPTAFYDSPEKIVSFYQDLLPRIRALPRVRQAGAIRSLPLAAQIGDWGLDVDGFVETPGNNAKGDWQVASDGAVEALGERLIRGRTFTPADTIDALPVALVNETMARTYWRDGDAIGGRIRMSTANPNRPWLTVVGIVGDVTHNGVTVPIKEKFYVPHSQFDRSVGNALATLATMTLVVRADADPLALVGATRAEIGRLDPNLPLSNVRPMTQVVADSIGTARFTGVLLAAFASLALTLAALGTYGLLAYVVSLRGREIGIRMAIGASRWHVLRYVLGRGSRLVVVGAVVGIVAALLTTRLMTALLHEVEALDVWTFAAAAALLVMVGLIACTIPALRATRIDPTMAMRE